jgi:tetratricopeptide (TPR) repeat protein
LDTKIAEAIRLRDGDKHDEAIALLNTLDKKDPNISYQIGWTYDGSDRSGLAIPHYLKSLELGLKDDRDGCFVALGSSLRATGDYKKSKEILEQGLREYPDHRPLKVFLAMTLYNLGEAKPAVTALLRELAETTSDKEIASYDRAFLSYAEDLDAIW